VLKRAVNRITLVLFAGLLAAPAAHAGVFPTGAVPIDASRAGRMRPVIAGPALAGGQVAWAQSRSDYGYDLELGAPATPRRIAMIGPARFLTLSASGTQIAWARHDSRTDEIELGTTGGGFARVAGCAGDCPSTDTPARAVDVTDGAAAWNVFERTPNHVHVDNLDGAAARDFGTGGAPFALAGGYLAVEDQPLGSSTIAVYDRATGTRIFAVSGSVVGTHPFDVQADGKLVYMSPERGLAWASPAEPYAHPIDLGPAPAHAPDEFIGPDIRVAGDRVVLRYLVDWTAIFVVGDLTGHPRVLPASAVPVGDFDFDGRRLVWAVRPCAVASVVSWDSASEPMPQTPRGTCPAAVVRSATRVDATGRITIRLSCSRSPLLGCRGGVDLARRDARDRRLVPAARQTAAFGLLSGRTGSVHFTLSPRTMKALRRSGRLRILARSTSAGTGQAARSQTRTKTLVVYAPRR
jgi:hypothetical protein